MTSARDHFLQRVREAVRAGNRAGTPATIEARGQVGYQGGGLDPAARFRDECLAAGGQAYLVQDRGEAIAKVVEILRERSLRRILVGREPFLDSLGLPEQLCGVGLEVQAVEPIMSASGSREGLFAAEAGISGVDYLVAETGTVVLRARPGEPRSLSLLPPVHIAVATRRQLIPDLFDLFEGTIGNGQPGLPTCLTLITGPSKTGDIELRLVTGVHGPGEVHVILVDA